MQRVFYDKERLFIKGEEVRGVQSIALDSSIPIEPISCLGHGFFGKESSGPIEASLSTSQIVVTTGEHFIFDNLSGYFWYSDGETPKSIMWESARLTSYNLKASVNSFVEVSTSVNIYGGVASGNFSPAAQNELTGGYIARPAFITTNIPFADDVAIQSVDYSLSVNVLPTYFIGSGIPEIDLILPIEITTTVQANLGEYDFENFRDSCNLTTGDLTITMRNCDDDLIKQVNAPNSTLISVSLDGQVEDRLAVTMIYKAYSNTTGGLI